MKKNEDPISLDQKVSEVIESYPARQWSAPEGG